MVGAGYVGLTTAVCVAERGHHTVCVDVDACRVDQLSRGVALLDEPGLPLLLQQGLQNETLRFSADYADLADCDVVFVCVPTPSHPDGSADLRAVDETVGGLASVLRRNAVLALKSTVPVGTTARRRATHEIRWDPCGFQSRVLARGPRDLMTSVSPTGSSSVPRKTLPPTWWDRVFGGTAPTLRMSPESAELAKYASNAFLAVKISYANSLARSRALEWAQMSRTSPDAWAPTCG